MNAEVFPESGSIIVLKSDHQRETEPYKRTGERYGSERSPDSANTRVGEIISRIESAVWWYIKTDFQLHRVPKLVNIHWIFPEELDAEFV